MKQFKLINEFFGYANKKDITNIDPRYLVAPSQNVLINDGEKVGPRPGYTLYGAASTSAEPVVGSYEWDTSTGTKFMFRSYDDELEFDYNDTFYRLANGFASDKFVFTPVWDTTEKIDFLIAANGGSSLYMWSGGVSTFASATSTTITKQGSTTWAQERFLKNGTRAVVIEGTTYTYTGGEGTTTLTGVSPDPSVAGHTVGALVHQALRESANTPASGFSNNVLGTNRNQLFVGDYTKREVYISANDDYTDFSAPTVPRAPGESAIVTLDSTPISFQPQEDVMYIGTNDGWFITQFQLSADLTAESLSVVRLKASRGKAPYAQQSVAKAGNYVVYFTNDKTIDFLGRVENIDTPESRPLSDVIKKELLDYDVTVAPHLRYFENNLYIAFPSEGKMLIYDFENRYWQPPQLMPIRRIAVNNGELYGHSSQVTETYKIFDETTYTDNGLPIRAICALAYRNYGLRAWKKEHSEWYTELYKTDNTNVTLTLKYDFGGVNAIQNYLIPSGLDSRFVFATIADGSLGKYPLGNKPLGSVTDTVDDLKKIKIIHEMKRNDYYEIQTQYSSYAEDQQWQLLATGGNVLQASQDNQDIKS